MADDNKAKLAERNKALQERWTASMEADFNPAYTPEHTPKAEDRLANAAEYTAFQLGQINRRLARLIELTESFGTKK